MKEHNDTPGIASSNVSTIHKYPRLFVTVDTILFTVENGALHVLLVERAHDPFKGRWAIPGGFVNANETLEQAALRKLREEASMDDVYLEQLYTYGETDRDPRGRIITVAYYALVDATRLTGQDRERTGRNMEGDEYDSVAQRTAQWFPVNELPELPFDHAEIIAYARQRLRYKLEYTAVGLQLLPELFSLSDVQNLYEAILDESLDKRNFRKKVLTLGILEATENHRLGAHRPARLYRFRDVPEAKGTPGFRWTKLEL